MRRPIVLAWTGALLLAGACDAGSRGSDGGASRDAATQSDAGSMTEDAATRDGGSHDRDAGTSDPDAGSICGPIGTWECGPVACHDVPSCLAADLERMGYDGYTECGVARSFTLADSMAACQSGPPFGDWPITFRCDQASFEGTLRFFCAPDGSAVVTRYQAHATMPPPMGTQLYTSWSTDYWEGSGGGSGTGHRHVDETGLGDGYVDFVGYHRTELPATGTIQSTVWFIVDPYFPGDATRFVGGGYQVTFDASGPVE